MTSTRTHVPSRRWVVWAFLGLAAFYLIVEHRAHLAGSLSWLPLGFLLLCPLMHVFGHGGHGSHGGHHDDGAPNHTHGLRSRPTAPAAAPDDESNTFPGGR